MVILNGNRFFPFTVLATLQKTSTSNRIPLMRSSSYQFTILRGGDTPVLGVLRDWRGGSEAALQHLEKTYLDWTQITIRRINGLATKSARRRRNSSRLQKNKTSHQSVYSIISRPYLAQAVSEKGYPF